MIRAKYTVVLKTLLDDDLTKQQIDNALSTYPIYTPDKNYDLIPSRSELNQKVLNHYKYREIGFETVGRFIDELEITMNEIMPRYNELFKSVQVMADLPSPFDNVDVVETFEETKTGTSKTDENKTSNQNMTGSQNGTATTENSSTSNNNTSSEDSSTTNTNMNDNSKNVKSSTPQSELNITANNIDSVSYADEVVWNKHNSDSDSTVTGSSSAKSTNTTSGTTTTTNEVGTTSEVDETSENNINTESESTTTHTFRKVGNQGVNTYAHDMNEFRTSIIDVVNMIINDKRLNELFMSVY